jgi:hypothetical protein
VEELNTEKDLGQVLNAYYNLALALNSFQRNEEVSIKELAERAGVHWNTAKKALLFFEVVKTIIPKFEVTQNLRFKIVEKQDPFEVVEGIFGSLEMRVITKMMLCRAVDSSNARSLVEVLSSGEKEVLPQLISKGYVNSAEGLYYLSRRGVTMGGLGLKKLIEAGIPLPWQRTTMLISHAHEIGSILLEGREKIPTMVPSPSWSPRLGGLDSEGWCLKVEERSC